MPLILPMRNIDYILKNKAIVTLKNNQKLVGKGDCLLYLPINDDTEEEDEFLRFILDNGETEYLSESDILSYELID